MKLLYSKFLNSIWISVRRLGERRVTLILSLIIGILSGVAAVVLKNTVHVTHAFLQESLPKESANLLFLGLPAVGILLTILFIKLFIKENINHGVSKVLYSISRQNSKIKSHNTYSSVVSSTLTIGFGGSVGAEAPIVYTGAAIGSNIGKFFRMNYKTLTLLVGCGSAGAIAAIFNAPLAGLVFTLEVLMLDLTTASIIPLLISAASATMVSYFFLGRDVVFTYEVVHPFQLHNIPYFILLGIFCGLVSLYFMRTVMRVEKKFNRVTNTYKKWIIGSIGLGILIFIFPPLYGEGYEVLDALLDGRPSFIFDNSFFYSFQHNYWLLLAALIMLVALKAIATAVTTGAGGVGGTFAPTLFIGGVSGFFVARFINQVSFINVSESNFTLVGMAGTMAGVMHAPLTAIFLIAEITGGYALFVPLIITATISFITIMYFEPHSIYTKGLAKKGELITHHKDKAVLTLLQVAHVVEKDFIVVSPDETLGNLVHKISRSKRNIFPVVTSENVFVGVVSLDDIRPIMFDTEVYESVSVNELMIVPPEYITTKESMDSVMKKFENSGAWNLPVLDGNQYVGFVSKSKIFSAYRDLLIQFSDE
ncbi:chloride channel protein [Tenuifilaceae bacterium CYCD]|nr:chloride channel protein [Tenuifilaceae bacterium CYCD]